MSTKLESIVTSKKMSQKLKEAGFEGETCFYWDKEGEIMVDPMMPNQYIEVPCFTFSQLWEALQEIEKEYIGIVINRYGGVCVMDYDQMDSGEELREYDVGNLADSVAEAILWCIKEGYL
jgi:hypothetical protein